MRILKYLTTWLLLLTFFLASGVVSGKVASGPQNLVETGYQGETVFNWLMHQGKSARSTTGPPGSSVAPKKPFVPNRQLPKDKHGHKVPESDYPHTQLGTKTSKRTGETYPQTREWGAKGDRGYDGQTPKKDTDWTNHGRPKNHSNPHDHPYNPDTGKRL